MKTNNLIAWKTRSFLIVILAIQISILSLVSLDILGIPIPILRPLIGFIYLIFIPGILILRILRLYKLNTAEIFVYSSGLSITTLMLVGLFMNWAYPIFGISKPLSLTYLISTISIFVTLLCFLSLISDMYSAESFNEPKISFTHIFSRSSALLCLIFSINILGIILVNSYGVNIATLISLLMISMIPLLVAFNKIPNKLYPLSIFIIAISLLYHISLISMFLYGRDSFNEYYISSITLKNLYWNLNIHDNVNSILSITILPSIFANICNIGLEWVFKIVYPFIFSLVPVTLYLVYKEQTTDKIAFMACFFFMAIISFYYEMPQLFRQEIAAFFYSLLLLLLLKYNISGPKKSILLIFFSVALILSHYGMSYIFAFLIFSLWLLLLLKDKFIFTKIVPFFKIINIRLNFNKVSFKSINSSFVAFFIVVVIFWYLNTSQSSVFVSIVHIGDKIISNFITDFFNPDTSQAVFIASSSKPLLTLQIITYLTLISQFLIGIGIFSIFFAKNKCKYNLEFIILSLLNFVFWVFAVIIPYFSSILTANRLYQITLLVISPYFVIGGFYFLRMFKKLKPVKMQNYLKILSIFLMIFFYFNVGIMGFFTGDKISMALDSSEDWPKVNNLELAGIYWISSFKEDKLNIFADVYKWPVVGAFNWPKTIPFSQKSSYSYGNSYIYLGKLNIKTGEALVSGGRFSGGKYLPLNHIIENRNEIYDNGGSIIYK